MEHDEFFNKQSEPFYVFTADILPAVFFSIPCGSLIKSLFEKGSFGDHESFSLSIADPVRHGSIKSTVASYADIDILNAFALKFDYYGTSAYIDYPGGAHLKEGIKP